jgi:hypothetical protein
MNGYHVELNLDALQWTTLRGAGRGGVCQDFPLHDGKSEVFSLVKEPVKGGE